MICPPVGGVIAYEAIRADGRSGFKAVTGDVFRESFEAGLGHAFDNEHSCSSMGDFFEHVVESWLQ